MASRVVRPETTTLQISGGDWLLVKKRLNHGERTDAYARKYITDREGTRVNLKTVDSAKVSAYLVDWSLTDLNDQQMIINGQSVDVIESFLNSIDPDSFEEIRQAIDRHELAMDLKRVAEKNGQDGAKNSPAISPSLDAVAGDSVTFVN